EWAGRYLLDIAPSGSYAKGTANRSGTDLDLFISLSPDTVETLSDIHKTLAATLKATGYQPHPQNVSIGIKVNGYAVDLVPGKRQNWLFNDHSLYKRRGDTWTKTDISQHIAKVKGSGRQAEIRLIKLWRSQKGLEFPSFYLELAVIKALETAWLSPLADNMRTVFAYLRDNIATARFVDPLQHQQHRLGRSYGRREAGHQEGGHGGARSALLAGYRRMSGWSLEKLLAGLHGE
ncbi:nucleotidyltransferase domain-containing protein, partial [Nostoc sp. NIES-2111]